MVRILFSLIFVIFSGVSALAEHPSVTAMTLTTQRLTQANRQAQTCDSKFSCAPFLQKLQTEDYSSRFFTLLKSRAPTCQRMVDRANNPLVANTFSDAKDLANQFAQMYPEIGAVNHNQITKCTPAGSSDAGNRYKVAKFYTYMKRFNEGATRAVEELAAINSLLGDNNPLPCQGRGTIPQAYNRCLQLKNNCSAAGGSQLPQVAAESAKDENAYLAAKDEIRNLQRNCLLQVNEYKKHAANLSAANPQMQRCEDVFVERQAPRKVCMTYTWAQKQKMDQCQVAQQALQISMASLEDKNPWFRSENYFNLRKNKSVSDSIREQMLTNRRELKKKVGEFEQAGLCINGFQSAGNCDQDKVRALLEATPELQPRTAAGRVGRASMYLEVQACVEEGVKDQAETAKVLYGASRDAVLTIATAGLSGVAMGAKAALTVRGTMVARAAMGGVIAIDGLYAQESFREAVKSCDGTARKIEIAAAAQGRECPGPKSNLSQAQRDHASCMSSVGFAALDALPLVPALARTAAVAREAVVARNAVPNTAARAATGAADATRAPPAAAVARENATETVARTASPSQARSATPAPARAASVEPTAAARSEASDVAAKADEATEVAAPAPVTIPAAEAVPFRRPEIINETTLDLEKIRANSQRISQGRDKAKIEDFLNPQLDDAVVVRQINSAQGAKKTEGFGGFNHQGVEILEVDGKQVFAKIVRASKGNEDEMFLKEMYFMKQMEDLGLGPKFLGTKIGADGRYRIVSELIEGTDLKITKRGSIEKVDGDLSFVTSKTIQDIRDINKKLIAAGIDPMDLQFRVDKTGKPYVVDTGMFVPLGSGSEVTIAKEISEQADVLQYNVRKFNEARDAAPAATRASPEVVAPGATPDIAPSSSVTNRSSSSVASTRSAASVESGSDVAAPSSRSVAPSSASARATSTAAPKEIARQALVEDYVGRMITTSTQNAEWIRLGSKVQSNGKTKFFVVENAMLKDLNDISLDKDLITALTNKRLEMTVSGVNDLVKKFPTVEAVPYSDFKSVRYAFSPKPPATKLPDDFDTELQSLYQKTNEQFAQFVKAQGVDSKLEDPAKWFRSGYGQTGDQAGYAARDARQQHNNVMQSFDNPIISNRLTDNVTRTEGMRQALATDTGLNSLMDKSAGRSSLKTEVFELVRKSDDVDDLKQQVSRTMGVELSDRQAQRIMDYSRSVDQFSPSINVVHRESASLTDAVNGGISLDFKGLGAQNLKETAEGLAKSKTGRQAIEESRLGEGGVTAQINVRKVNIRETIQEIANKNDIKIDIRTSGDDMVILPNKPLTVQVRQQISEALARKVPPGSLRVSHIPAGIPEAQRAKLGVMGEDIEKRLRLDLQGKISQERLDKVLFSVDMEMNKATSATTANLRTSSRDMAISEEEMKKIESAFDNAVRDAGAQRNLTQPSESMAPPSSRSVSAESASKPNLSELQSNAALSAQEKARVFERVNNLPAGSVSNDASKVQAIDAIEARYPTPVSNTPAAQRPRSERTALAEKRRELKQLGFSDQQIQRGMDQGIFGAPQASTAQAAKNNYERYSGDVAKIQNSYPSTALGELTKQRDLATSNRLAAESATSLNRQSPGSVNADKITQHWRSAAVAQEKYIANDMKTNFKSGETGNFFVRFSDAVYSKKPGLGFDAKKFDEQSGRIREIQRRFESAFEYNMKAGNQEKAKEIIMRSPLLQNTKDPNYYFDRTFLPYYKEKGTTVGAHGL